MSGYDARFAELEERLSSEIAELRGRVESKIEELNSLVAARADDVEAKSVPRKQIASSLERLAETLRG